MNKILIIENDMEIANLEREYLEANEFQVTVEVRGNTGLAKALEEKFDVVILEVVLPGVDGFEICRKIRETQDIPILIVSEKNEESDKICGLELGADDYITKPFAPNELVARVKAHLARYNRLLELGTESRKNMVEAGGIKIDMESHQVFVDGQERVMTAKEFDTLAFLAQHPNRVYTKEELFEKIWGMEAYGDVASVAVYINKIREKIEANSSNPKMIETIWGVGYRFKL